MRQRHFRDRTQHSLHRRERRERPSSQKTIGEIEQELVANYNSIIDQFQTPFDIICDICLFKNNLENSEEQLIEIHNEKLDILIALFNELSTKHIKIFERFLNKLNDLQSLTKMFANSESNKKKVMIFILDIANYANQNIRSVKVNKYKIRQVEQMDQEIHQDQMQATQSANRGDQQFIMDQSNGDLNQEFL